MRPGSGADSTDATRSALETSVGGDRAQPRADAPIGTRMGRYQLMSLIGAGGMGVVFAAHDPELDRTVAVKIMHDPGGADSASGELRLRREAQAMARLTHPNMIRVFDIGVARGTVFVAMEYVEGGTLAQWLDGAPRTPAEIIATFVQAGRGLAAAHDAGLVHRDFKPSNVLVGADDRVIVSDFGLALEAGDGSASRAGVAVGTPGFMSPEQRAGLSVDARADQFSFCVALWRALFGAAPYPDGADRLAAPPPERAAAVPPRVHAALARGLRASPAERFPSMHALLRALAPAIAPRRWRWIALVAGVALIAGAGVWIALGHDATAADPCATADDRFAGVWDASAARAVHDAFAATRTPYAEPAYREVARELDGDRAAWIAMRHDSCVATRVRHVQSDAMMDLRAACLEHRLGELGAFVTELRTADADAVRGAAQQAAAIVDVTACADVDALARRAPRPADPARRAAIEAVTRELATERAHDALGNHRDDDTARDALIAHARATGYPPILSEALREVAWADSERGRQTDADALLQEAVLAADAGADDQARFDAEVLLVTIEGYKLERDADSQRHAEDAQALLTRLGADDRRAGSLARARATVDWWHGRYPDGRKHAQEAVELFTRVDPAGVDLGRALHTRAIVEQEMGDALASIATEARSRAILEHALGPEHPVVAQSWETTGGSLRQLGRLDEARHALERGLEIVLATDGPDSAGAGGAFMNLGLLYDDAGDHELAIATLRRAVAAHEHALGPDHSRTADSIEALADTLSMAGHGDEAVAAFERAIAIHDKKLGADAPPTASSRRQLGEHYLRNADPTRARALFVEAVRALEASQGKTSAMLANPLVDLGDAERALHHAAAAAAAYRRAGDVVGTDPHYDKMRARIRDGLAASRP